MKKKTVLCSMMLAIVMACSVTACTKAEPESTDSGKETVRETQEEHLLVGTLADITKENVTIRDNDGKEYNFKTDGIEWDLDHGIQAGSWIEVTYTGTMKDENTEDVSVIEIEDDSAEIDKTKEAAILKEVDEKVYATKGVNLTSSFSADSDVVTSLKKGAEIKQVGAYENGWVKVEHQGKEAYVYSTNIADKIPSSNEKDEESHYVKKETGTTEETKEGVIKDISLDYMLVEVDGKEHKLYVGGAEIDLDKGLVKNDTVKITYAGNFAQKPFIVKIEDI